MATGGSVRSEGDTDRNQALTCAMCLDIYTSSQTSPLSPHVLSTLSGRFGGQTPSQQLPLSVMPQANSSAPWRSVRLSDQLLHKCRGLGAST
ncbi:hypothetical protein BaRGS_00034399 [Batillaria attramentaria]|uniref:Uncharacterized protein n=1 Tax=Batillaria attramentaria TaxID=370345 RepID=A0ABD0JHL1_9CAEN